MLRNDGTFRDECLYFEKVNNVYSLRMYNWINIYPKNLRGVPFANKTSKECFPLMSLEKSKLTWTTSFSVKVRCENIWHRCKFFFTSRLHRTYSQPFVVFNYTCELFIFVPASSDVSSHCLTRGCYYACVYSALQVLGQRRQWLLPDNHHRFDDRTETKKTQVEASSWKNSLSWNSFELFRFLH